MTIDSPLSPPWAEAKRPLTAPDAAPTIMTANTSGDSTASADPAHESRPVLIWRGQQWEEHNDAVSREVPVLLRLPDGLHKLWAWPHDLENLVRGHLLLDCGPKPDHADNATASRSPDTASTPDTCPDAKKVAKQPAELAKAPCPAPDTAPIWILRRLDDAHLPNAAHGVPLFEALPLHEHSPVPDGALRVPSEHSAYRRQIGTTSVSPCVPQQIPTLRPQRLIALMERCLALSGPWDATGCFHRLALWRLDATSPEICRVAEDIGRHNCLDRLAGWLDREGLDPANFGLLLSARVTASLYAKARRAGFAVLISRAAVSSAAVDAAQADGVTLVGFCRPREGRLTVFADPARRLDLAADSGACDASFFDPEPNTDSAACHPCSTADSGSDISTACSYACSDICCTPTVNNKPDTTPGASSDTPLPALPGATS